MAARLFEVFLALLTLALTVAGFVIQDYAMWLWILAGVVFLAFVGTWVWERRGKPSMPRPMEVSTRGDQSPAINVSGNQNAVTVGAPATKFVDPLATIRAFNAHIEAGRGISQSIKAMSQPTDEEWIAMLIEVRDWLRDALEMVDEHCPGRRQDFLLVWRSVPVPIRQVQPYSGEALALGKYPDTVRLWIQGATGVLNACIAWLEQRPHG